MRARWVRASGNPPGPAARVRRVDFGFKRAEVLSAQANGITLLVISALVAFEAISRLIHPLPVTGGIVVTVAAVGVAVNVAATWILARANRDSINVRGAFAHVVTDLYGFIGTLVAGIVIIVTASSGPTRSPP